MKIRSFLAFDPILGKLNPLAPPLEISVEDQVAVGKVNFGVPYEGAHGHVHGGFIAGAFDDTIVYSLAILRAAAKRERDELILNYEFLVLN